MSTRFVVALLLGIPWGGWGCWRLHVAGRLVDEAFTGGDR